MDAGSARRSGTIRIAVFVFDGCEELDWAGPWEVLSVWARGWPEDRAEVFILGEQDGVVTCAKGLRILPDQTWATSPPIDVLVYPGGIGTRSQLGQDRYRSWLGRLRDEGALLTSVCTGALVLADAGILDGQPATTHWEWTGLLASLGQGIDVRPDERFVDAGAVVTAAGVSAGIDMALHLVRRLHSADRARQVRRRIQYDPQPPV
jgi:transcriptional regulator GlxA family with amidase domain